MCRLFLVSAVLLAGVSISRADPIIFRSITAGLADFSCGGDANVSVEGTGSMSMSGVSSLNYYCSQAGILSPGENLPFLGISDVLGTARGAVHIAGYDITCVAENEMSHCSPSAEFDIYGLVPSPGGLDIGAQIKVTAPFQANLYFSFENPPGSQTLIRMSGGGLATLSLRIYLPGESLFFDNAHFEFTSVPEPATRSLAIAGLIIASAPEVFRRTRLAWMSRTSPEC